MTLSGKRIIVTGGSSGIGKAIAIEAAKEGAVVAIIARDQRRLDNVKGEIVRPEVHRYLSIDLSKPMELADALNTYLSEWENVDGFVHAAGQSSTLPLNNSSAAKLSALWDVHVASGLELAKWCGTRKRLPAHGASWIFISSVSAKQGHRAKSLYSTVKSALGGMTRSLAVEMAPKKVRVNTILPGMVETPMTRNAVYRSGDGDENIQRMHPLGLGFPVDIAHAAIFLLSDKSRWITGTEWCVDGGYSISKSN